VLVLVLVLGPEPEPVLWLVELFSVH